MRLLFLYEMVCSIKWPNPSFRKCLLASMKSHRWCFYQHFCHQRICNSYFMKLKPSEMESYYLWSLITVHFFSTTYKDGIPVGGKSPSTGSTEWKWLFWVQAFAGGWRFAAYWHPPDASDVTYKNPLLASGKFRRWTTDSCKNIWSDLHTLSLLNAEVVESFKSFMPSISFQLLAINDIFVR